ncbi:lipase family protein [Rhodococcus sp. Z13]|uniref:Lipase family protein n=1 Tax=Rhodococcus sacchari TaxID=2962047 RepID=A0ACD4DIK9_9NOCA|nr:lipase family protein [Rhodococcus sp. Z13]UYP19905.1 lipase family protein [Rhodococcus sp. Z13]
MAAAVTLSAATGVAQAAPVDGRVVVEGSETRAPSTEVPGASEVVTFTYRTEGAEGVSTAQIFVPEGEAPPGGWPIVAWAHGTVGMTDADAPSRTGVQYDIYRNLYGDWLKRGFLVVATDYAGLGTPGVHPYLNADVAAHNVVDSVVAARELIPDASRVWAVAGQSQGGHAALATATRAADYAPDLDFRGTFASGPPTNLDRLTAIAGPEFPPLRVDGLTLYMAYIAAGLHDSRPDLDLAQYMTPLGLELVEQADALPMEEFRQRLAGVYVGDLFARPIAGTPVEQAISDYFAIDVDGFDRPVMIVQGLADTVVPPPLTFWFAADLALAGEDFDLRLPVAGHVEGLAESTPEIGDYLESILR